MWLDAARAPAAVRPDFTSTIGFLRDTRRAISTNRFGSLNDSRYMQITRVPGSSSQYSSRSLAETSAVLPTETNCESPRPSPAAMLSTATPSAPDWLTKPIAPGSGGVGEKVASSRTSAAVLKTPMQFGPTSRPPAARTRALSSSSSARPSAPVSEKPAVITTMPRTPRAMHSSITPATASRGTRITARSIGSGIAASDG